MAAKLCFYVSLVEACLFFAGALAVGLGVVDLSYERPINQASQQSDTIASENPDAMITPHWDELENAFPEKMMQSSESDDDNEPVEEAD